MPNISRTKTWASNETLTASDLNAEFNGILTGINDNALDADNLTLSDAYAWTGLHTFNNANTVLGHTAALTTNAANQLQVLGTADADSSLLVGRFSADASGGQINFAKSRDGTIGDKGAVADNDVLGGIYFYGCDVTGSSGDFATPGASVLARVNGTPGANDLPTELVFSTTADAANSTTERLRISQAGLVEVVGDLSVGDDVTLGSDSAVLSMGAGNDVTLTHDGTTGVTIAATPITVDSGGNLTLDAHTGIHIFKDAGTEVLRFTEGNSGDVTIKLATNGKDLVFTDNGDATNLKVLDAAAGINVPGEVQTTKIAYTDGDDAITIADGGGVTTASTLAIGSVAAAGSDVDKFLVLDGSGNVDYRTGTEVAEDIGAQTSATAADDIATGDAAVSLVTTSGNITIDAQANDADVIIKVDDGGSAVTAVTFDGSDEGNAIFVNDVQLKSDSAVLEFGADLDTSLTHTDGTGLTLNSTNKLTFGDAASFIQQSADGTLRIDGEAIIDLNASTRVDVSGALAVGSTITSAAITATDTTAPLILKYDAQEYVTHAVSSAGVYSIATTDDSSDSGAITLDTVDSITLDSDTATEGIKYADGGTDLLRISNSSNNVIIKPLQDAKDIVFQQYDGTEVVRVTDAKGLGTASGTALKLSSNGVAWEFPTADGSADQYLKTDGSGNLDWASTGSGGVDAANGDSDRIATFTDSNSLNGEATLTFADDVLTATSTSANLPKIELKNTHAGATAGILQFTKDSASGADSDTMGTISFFGTDASNNTEQELAKIEGIVAEADHGSETGKLTLSVAENDGTVTAGLILTGSTATDGEIDVTLGAGAASAVTIPGVIGSATWQGDVIASAYLDSDTAHLTTTQTFSGAKTFSADFLVQQGTDTTTATDPIAYFERTGDSQTGVVVRANSIDGLLYRADGNGFGGIHAYQDMGFYVATRTGSDYGTQALRIETNGLVGVNHNDGSSSHKFQVDGTAGLSTGTAWTNTSDARIKTDVATITGALAKIKQLRPVSFKYTKQYLDIHDEIDGSRTYNSFIADEYANVFPDAVNDGGDLVKITDEETDEKEVILETLKQYTPTDLPMYLVAAVKELATRVEALEA